MASARRDRALLLCGMMGSGKTRVGRLLAARLDWEFVDSDERIALRGGQPIDEIFERSGEAEFRRMEREILAELPGRDAVIALGGGALIAAENRALLREKGTLIWLDARPESLLARVGEGSPRPLLSGLDRSQRLTRLRALAEERAPAYREADLRVATDHRTPEEVCRAVLETLGWEAAA